MHTRAQGRPNGHLDCLKFLYMSGCPGKYVAVETVAAGHLNCIQYQVRRGALVRTEMITEAIKHQHEDILQFSYEHSPETFSNSSGYDWCRQAFLQNIPYRISFFNRDCTGDINTCRRAIQKGNFACAQYVIVLTVTNPRLVLLTPDQSAKVTVQQNECIRFLFQRCEQQQAVIITTIASEKGNVVALRKLLLQQGWSVNSSVVERAARDNDILTLQAYCATLCLFLPAILPPCGVTRRYYTSHAGRKVPGMFNSITM